MGVGLPLQDRKGDLRRRLLDRRRQQLPVERRRNSLLILDRCRDLAAFRRAELICSFIGFGEEIETAGFVRSLVASGRRVAVPTQRAGSGTPAFSELSRWEELTPNSLGILEPERQFLRLVPTSTISLFLVPGLGFDVSGGRLGYGLGFYDRALAEAAPDAIIAGLSFEFQIVSCVPTASHDLAMDLIITENRVLKTSKRAKFTEEVC